MSTVQSTFQTYFNEAQNGALVKAVPNTEVDSSFRNMTASNGTIPWGRVVQQGTNAHECLLGMASADKFLGVSVMDQTLANNYYESEDNVIVLKHGHIWVLVAEAVTLGGAVFVHPTTGEFYAAAGSSPAKVEVKGLRYAVAASANGLTRLELDSQARY